MLLALSIGAAACGSTESSTAPTLATSVTTAPAATSAFAPPADEPPADESSTESSTTETTAPAVNLFPDIDVLNIADGATVNLATELGGGDKATLLWFFAPH